MPDVGGVVEEDGRVLAVLSRGGAVHSQVVHPLLPAQRPSHRLYPLVTRIAQNDKYCVDTNTYSPDEYMSFYE